MTTFAALKTQLAALIADPDAKTFSTTDLGYFINTGIAAVSRIAPQRFQEDITLNDATLEYRVRGGDGNLLANPSFESCDSTLNDATFPGLTLGTADAGELTDGWLFDNDTKFSAVTSTSRKTGAYVGRIVKYVSNTITYMYQDIEVNADTTYLISGWHWNGHAGDDANLITVDTLDSDHVVVTAAAFSHSTTSATPVFASGSYAVPASGVTYLRVKLIASTNTKAYNESYYFEDITLVEANDANLVADNAVGDIELRRVEVWTNEVDPPRPIMRLMPGSAEYVNYSEAGWDFWNGILSIPYRIHSALDTSLHYLRVWGYAPYDQLTTADQVTDLSASLEQAVMAYARVEALQRLQFERDLFTQWQTRSGATDVTPAALMNALSLAREDWRRMARALAVLREAP